MDCPASSTNIRGLERNAPSTPFDVCIKIKGVTQISAATPNFGMYAGNSTNGRLITWAISPFDFYLAASRWSSATAFNGGNGVNVTGFVNGETSSVLGGTLSPLDGIGPKDIHLDKLINRAADGVVGEVVLATNFTNEGEVTAHYLSEMLKSRDIRVSRIARGVPVGGELEYVDPGTLAQAMRQTLCTSVVSPMNSAAGLKVWPGW